MNLLAKNSGEHNKPSVNKTVKDRRRSIFIIASLFCQTFDKIDLWDIGDY